MTDTERISELMRVKNLNNVQFSQLTGIATATLSHITSGRTNPSLAILRNVVTAFPDVNPEWIFMGQGEMFLSEDGQDATDSPIVTDVQADSDPPRQPVRATSIHFPPVAAAEGASRNRRPSAYVQPDLFGSSSQTPALSGRDETQGVTLADIMNELRKTEKRPVRKITEIRIFFDDGTYESFGKS